MRLKKMSRSEGRQLILNLIDLGFTVPAVAFMLQMTDVNIYLHLKRAGRMKNRKVIRHPGDESYATMLTTTDIVTAMSRVFSAPQCHLLVLAGMANYSRPTAETITKTRRRKGSPEWQRGTMHSMTRAISRRSARAAV